MHFIISPLLMIVAIVWKGDSVTVDNCPPGLVRNDYLSAYNNWCFQFAYTGRKDYDDARDDCRINRGTLALVKDQGIQDFLGDKMKEYSWKYDQSYVPLWIGLNDKVAEGTFVWEDGTNVTYNNWGPNEGPTNIVGNSEDCVTIGTFEGKWEDVPCEDDASPNGGGADRPYICQYNADGTEMVTASSG